MGKNQQKWQVRLMKLMRGRYGRFDTLSKHVLLMSFILLFLNIFLRSSLMSVIVLIGIVSVYYRLFSKKIYVRSNENQTYVRRLANLKKPFVFRLNQLKYRKDYHYFKCVNCKQATRVPRNRGKIVITCPSCHEKFEKNS